MDFSSRIADRTLRPLQDIEGRRHHEAYKRTLSPDVAEAYGI